MTDEPEHRPQLRAGADDGPDRLITTPPGRSEADHQPGRRRRLLLIAGLVAAIVLITGGVATAVHHSSPAPGKAALVTDPAAPTISMLPPASPVASGEGGASSGADVERTSKARPATSKPSPSKPAPSSKPAAAPALHPLAPGAVISLEPTDLPGSRLRHSASLAWVDPLSASSPALDRADARWIVHAGMADPSCISLESSNYPGEYLRHQNSRLRRDAPDGSDLFKSDATFCPEAAGSPNVVRLRSSNYPDRYLKRQDTAMYLADAGVAGETFTVRPPL